MCEPKGSGQLSSFVVPGYDEDGNSRFSEPGQGVVSTTDDFSIDTGAEEEIAPVEEEFRSGAFRVVEDPLEVFEEVLSPASNVYPGAKGVVET